MPWLGALADRLGRLGEGGITRRVLEVGVYRG